ncbi:MAG: DinB family protein [Bacteroidia bacterium]
MNSARAENLLSYEYWANAQFFQVLDLHNEDSPEEALSILSHISGARQIWYNRVYGIPSGKDLMQSQSLEKLKLSNETLRHLWSELVHKVDPESKIISYSNFSGEAFQTPLSEIITHLVNHGSYHRGQVARLLRETGIKPPATDFIVFARL